jgi:YD repeat-containing protein
MKKLLVIITVLQSLITLSQNNDIKLQKLVGDLKSIKSIDYKAVEKFGEISKGKSYEEYSLIANSTFTVFNKDGYIIEINYYDKNNVLLFKEKYTYNDENKLLETTTYKGNGRFSSKYKYSYSNRTIRINTYDYNGNNLGNFETKKIDNNGKVVELIGSSGYSYIYKYNSGGNIIERAHYLPDGEFNRKRIYKYDNLGNIIEEKMTQFDGRFGEQRKYKYDNLGNKIEELMYTNNELDFYTLTFKYEFEDKSNSFFSSKKNWIKCIEFINGSPTKITERKLNYY